MVTSFLREKGVMKFLQSENILDGARLRFKFHARII